VSAIIILWILPFAGMNAVTFSSEIFQTIRLPRAIMSFVAGAVLGVCGMSFQSMFRNDLATPYTLGISSGAALGAVIAIKFLSLSVFPFFSLVQMFSFLGALATVLLIYSAVKAKGRMNTDFLLLAGVAVNFTFSGLILFVQYLASGSESSMMIRWMTGSLDITGFEPVLKIIPALIIFPVALYLHRELDLMRINSDIAASRGVNLKKTGNIIFFAVSFAVAIVVSQIGPIGFVGMIAPHIGRKLISKEHKYLAVASFLIGGMILMIADTISRTIIAPSEIPAGVITALIGGPFFLFVLIRKKS
jgi:iron complex transport system permease protein